jgi:hypothetical protein
MSGFPATPLSDAQADAILLLLKNRLRIVRTGPQRVAPGSLLSAKLIPTSSEIDASDLVNGVVDLTAVVKDILFKDRLPFPPPDNPSDPDAVLPPLNVDPAAVREELRDAVAGGQPFAAPTAVLNQPNPIQTNIEGMLAQLFGTLQLPNLKVGVGLKWTVRAGAGAPLSESADFIALEGISSPTFSAVVAPPMREYRADTLLNPGGMVVCLWLDVRLTLGERVLDVQLGGLPYIQLPILIPTMVALFSEANFDLTHDSAALIVVPEHSPFMSLEPLMKLLLSLETTLSKLRGIARLAGFFLGLDEALGSLPQQPRLRLTAKNRIDHLGNYTIKRRPWWNPLAGDRTFDDTVNSILVLGAPGTEVEFFNDKNCKRSPDTDQGDYVVRLNAAATNGTPPDVYVAIRTLYTSNDVAPPTTPPGRIVSFNPDDTGDDEWHTDLTSLRFKKSFLDSVAREMKEPPPVPVPNCVWTDPGGSTGNENPPTGAPRRKSQRGAKSEAKKEGRLRPPH